MRVSISSVSPGVKGFEDTDNKRCIRRMFDLPIIRAFQERKMRQLYYFGLTGPEMHDVVDWRQLLAQEIMSAENDSNFDAKIGRMNSVGDDLGFQVRVLRGEIEHAMLRGVDIDGEAPLRSRKAADGYLYFEYDLVNLDFVGGPTYRRMNAISELLKRQSQTECLLLVTFNVRHLVQNALAEGLVGLRGRLESPVEAERILHWYEQQTDTYKIKALVPGAITAAANHAKLDCFAYPPVIYDGKKAKLVHFVFHLSPHEQVLRGSASQSEKALLCLPTLYISEAVLELHATQAPDFDLDAVLPTLAFLGQESIDTIVERFATKTVQTPTSSSLQRRKVQ